MSIRGGRGSTPVRKLNIERKTNIVQKDAETIKGKKIPWPSSPLSVAVLEKISVSNLFNLQFIAWKQRF